MSNDKRTLFALILLAIALLIWRALSPSPVLDTPGASPASTKQSSADSVEEADQPREAGRTPIANALKVEAASVPSLVPPQRARRLSDYADAPDLQQFIEGLRAAADAGDGEAAALIARAYDECFLWVGATKSGRRMTVDPATLAEPQRTATAVQTAITERRCAGIVAQAMQQESGWTIEQIRLYQGKARDDGELSQSLYQRGLSYLELSSADDIDLLRRMAASGNDDTVAALAMMVAADPGGERDIQGPYSGQPVDFTAWLLVSCHLGRDCEANGRLVRQQCLMLGHCIAGSYRDYVRYYMATPYQFDEAQKKERQILDLLARGAVDELFPLRPKRD